MNTKIITCAPASKAAELGYPNTHYEKVECPECGQQMYLGPRSKKLHLTEKIPMMCMECAVKSGLLHDMKQVKHLGGP